MGYGRNYLCHYLNFVPVNCLDDCEVYNLIWDGFDLLLDLGRFWFTTWFGTVMIYNLIWDGYVLQLDLGQLWFTTRFGPVLIYNLIWIVFIFGCENFMFEHLWLTALEWECSTNVSHLYDLRLILICTIKYSPCVRSFLD